MSNACPCGSSRVYEECCGPLHAGEAAAPTAERLMRSRYSAYRLGLADYLLHTLHPSQREEDTHARLRESETRVRWRSLQILDAVERGADAGEVEFVAAYQELDDGMETTRFGRLHERSKFVREDGRWFYVTGVYEGLLPLPKIGRNDPCWCGSGKKSKKCRHD